MVVILVIVSGVIAFFIYRWCVRHYIYTKHLVKFPSPPPLPIFGNALELASPSVLLQKFLEYRKYGGTVKLYIGPTPSVLLVNDYKFAEYLLSSTKILDKSAEYQYLSSWLGRGLLLANGDAKWKKHRKIITPTFHFQILEQFIEVFESTSKILLEKLQKEMGKPSVNIYPYMVLCTLDIICETAMGTSIKAQENSESEYVQGVKTMCQIMIDRSFNPLLQNTFFYFFTPQYRREKKAIKILHDYTDSVIKKRRAELKNEHKTTKSDDEIGIRKKLAFLDLLLLENSENQTLSDQDLREEVDTFMFEGHDTTASAISFALYCLAENPEVQKKVVEELRTIYADNKFRPTTYKDLHEMKYLKCVIKEVLRLYPSIPFFARHVREDTEYDGGILPKGLTITINAYGVHRNPELFPEPEKFIPERFFAENSTSRSPYSYIPFSAGARNCIGQKYAMLELKTLISTILKNYELLPAIPEHNLSVISETILFSANGVCIRLAARDF